MRTILAAILAVIAVPAIAQGAPDYQQPGVLHPLFPPPPHPGMLQPPSPNAPPAYQPPQTPALLPGQRLQTPPPGSNTQIPNTNASGLAPPPAGYVWERQGSDAVLVNTQTGAILRVRHHAF